MTNEFDPNKKVAEYCKGLFGQRNVLIERKNRILSSLKHEVVEMASDSAATEDLFDAYLDLTGAEKAIDRIVSDD